MHEVRPGELNCDLVQPGLPFVLLPRTTFLEYVQRVQAEIRALRQAERDHFDAVFAAGAERVRGHATVPSYAELERRRGEAA